MVLVLFTIVLYPTQQNFTKQALLAAPVLTLQLDEAQVLASYSSSLKAFKALSSCPSPLG